ncbi:hypothetical protein [Nocardioides sp. 1609]|uniref:hypothetical protein n=1 Tax=Nocardioides sp. 1609 TaxID=2508327 RepID=UPI0010706729|nr:hypothetical protein [Nocardioides sp. 1609]
MTTRPPSPRRTRAAALAALAAVLVPLALAGCGGEDDVRPRDDGRAGPGARATTVVGTEPPASATPAAARMTASDDGLGGWAFGDAAEPALEAMTGELGAADVDTGWEEFRRLEGHAGWYRDDDPLSDSWRHRYFRAACWASLCSIFGGSSPATATFLGWEVSDFRRWDEDDDPDPTGPRIALEGSGIRLGDTWADFRAAYPGARAGGGEGASLVIGAPPWPGIVDGVGAWRMSGSWDADRPTWAPDHAVVTRMSGGVGPAPGCC